MSFKLSRASAKGGQPLAPASVTHHPALSVQGKYHTSNGVLKVDGTIGNLSVQFLLDSGAAVSVIHYKILDSHYQQQITPANVKAAVTANGGLLEVLGQITLPIGIGHFNSTHLFTVVRNLTVECILGADYLIQHGAVIDCNQCCLTVGGVQVPFYAHPVESNHSDSLIHSISDTVKVLHTVKVRGRSIQPIELLLPTQIATLGVSDVLIEQQMSSNTSKQLLFPRTLSHVSSGGHPIVHVINTGPVDLILYKNTSVGYCTPVQNLLAIEVDNSPTVPNLQPHFGADLSSSALSPSQRQSFLKLLDNYSDLFVSTDGEL